MYSRMNPAMKRLFILVMWIVPIIILVEGAARNSR